MKKIYSILLSVSDSSNKALSGVLLSISVKYSNDKFVELGVLATQIDGNILLKNVSLTPECESIHVKAVHIDSPTKIYYLRDLNLNCKTVNLSLQLVNLRNELFVDDLTYFFLDLI